MKNFLFILKGYPASVDGSSMKPTINEERSFCSDWVFVNCWSAKDFNLSRGEIVVFNSPVGNKVLVSNFTRSVNRCYGALPELDSVTRPNVH
jgi:signal peptidase I